MYNFISDVCFGFHQLDFRKLHFHTYLMCLTKISSWHSCSSSESHLYVNIFFNSMNLVTGSLVH